MNNDIKNIYDAPPPEHTRGFFDPEKTREWMKEYAVQSFEKALNKIETPDFKLQVKNVHLEDPNRRFSLKDQKQAILEKRDLTLPIKAEFELIDKKTGKSVEKKKTTVAHIPYLTDRNTVIINGSEYITTNQQRLKPGVYTRLKETGEVEAHVNPKTGTGMMAKLIFDPEKAVFTYNLGTTGIKLYGLLKELGVSDAEMEQAWGKEIFLRNKASYEGKEIEKMYKKIFTY